MAVLDFGVDTYLKGERIMFHPEVEPNPSTGLEEDFFQRGSYERVDDDDFNNIPYLDLRLSAPLTLLNPQHNAIRMEPGQGIISGLNNNRKEDLSLFRDWWPTDPDPSKNMHDMCSASGLYLLSVTVKADIPSTMTESSTPLMNITITTVDSMDASTPRSFTFTLEERHFFDVNHNLITTPIEVLLGAFELRQTGFSPAVSFAVERDISHPLPNPWTPNQWWPKPWADTTLIRYERLIDPDDRVTDRVLVPRPDSLDFKFGASDLNIHGAFDLSIEYGSGSATFLLDAVCLSSPRAFGMLHPDHATFNATFPAYAAVRNNYIHRTDRLLRDGGTGVLPGMRFLYGPEQGLHSSNWPVSTLAQKLLDSISGGVVSLYCASGYSEPTAVSSAFNRRFTSGFYSYPIAMPKLPPPSIQHGRRPVFPGIDVNEYHDSLNQTARRGFVETSRIYRRHAELRKQGGAAFPWIPFVQNHSNLFLGNQGENWNDGDWMREPTAAELRHQCNIALANDADGVMFYALVSTPGEFTLDQWWPETRQEWVDDSSLTGGEIDMNAGMMGYLDRNLDRRRCDWNGESKWDSTVAYIHGFLRPVADTIQQNLIWQDTKIWSIRGASDAGTNQRVNEVISFRQDVQNPDEQGETHVMISEFAPRRNGNRSYLLVLNGRTHPVEGHRHITVKLTNDVDPTVEWRVTNLMTNDIWIVRPTASPDRSISNNGFTEYFPPGTAALYLLEKMVNETTDFVDTFPEDASHPCPNRSVFIEPMATLRLKSTDRLAFGATDGVFCDGELIAQGSQFGPCTSEGSWSGIVVRNGGIAQLEEIFMLGAGVITGSGATATLDEACEIIDTYVALQNNGGTLHSNSTTSSGVVQHLGMIGYGTTTLVRDQSTACDWSSMSTAMNILASGTTVGIDECVFTDFKRGIYAWESSVAGDVDQAAPADGGNNSVEAEEWVLKALVSSWMDFGELPVSPSWEARNVFLTTTTGYHAWVDAGSSIIARHCWWEPVDNSQVDPIRISSGNIEYSPMLPSNPMFVGGGGASFTGSSGFGKTASPPPPSLRDLIKAAVVQRNHGTVRHLIGQYLQSPAFGTADFNTLRFLHGSLRSANARMMIDSLFALCLARQDMDSKLLAADIATEDSQFADALGILNAYSFVGSPTLLKRSLLRKVLLYPRAWRQGYNHGLLALDSLRAMNDSLLQPMIEMYPILYSRLTVPTTVVPKRSTEEVLETILPDGIDVWPNYPNPFTDVTSFTFKLGEDRHVRLAVYDAMGREVAVVTDADYPRGVHSAVLRSSGLPSGLYFYRLTTDAGVIQRKMLLMR